MVGFTRALALVLVAGTALAQPQEARVRREQSVTVTGNPAHAIPELHAAPDVATLVLFDADIQPDGVEVERARVKLVGAGARFLILQLQVALEARERVILRVPYADGQSPESAVFAIVAHPTEVNTRVEVTRLQQSASACQAELAEASARCSALSPTRFVRDGGVGKGGVRARRIKLCPQAPPAQGLRCHSGRAYSAETWTLVEVVILNEGQAPWRPGEARLVGMQGTPGPRVRSVEGVPSVIAPGMQGRVLVEGDAMAEGTAVFSLELSDGTGWGLVIPDVQLEKPEEGT